MEIQNFTKVMKALSDPGRVKMLKLMERRELCVCELQAALGLAQPTISKHLKVLEEAGLAVWRRQGSWVLYRLAEPGPDEHAGRMLGLLRGLLDHDPELTSLLDQLDRICREDVCRPTPGAIEPALPAQPKDE